MGKIARTPKGMARAVAEMGIGDEVLVNGEMELVVVDSDDERDLSTYAMLTEDPDDEDGPVYFLSKPETRDARGVRVGLGPNFGRKTDDGGWDQLELERIEIVSEGDFR